MSCREKDTDISFAQDAIDEYKVLILTTSVSVIGVAACMFIFMALSMLFLPPSS